MFCRNCGAEQAEDSKFCVKCGAPLPRTESTDAPAGQPSPQPQAEAEPEQVQSPEPAEPVELPVAAPEQAPEPKQEPSPGAAAEPKKGPNIKLIAIIAGAAVAIAAIAALVIVFLVNNADDGLTDEERMGLFVGEWVAQDSSDESMGKEWFDYSASQGIYIELFLWDDGTGVFRTDAGPVKLTWEAKTQTSATATMEEQEMDIVIKGKQLTMTNPDGVELYFVPADEVDMSNAIDVTNKGNGVTVDPDDIQVGEYSKLIGNYSVGFMQIPRGWVNRIDDIDPEFVKDYEAVFYVDSTTEYTSPSQGRFAFSQSVQMSRHATGYKELAAQLEEAYKSDDKYGDCVRTEATIGKRRAIILLSENKVDGVTVASIVIDRDNDSKVSVVLSWNCGTTGNDKALQWCMDFSTTWQVE